MILYYLQIGQLVVACNILMNRNRLAFKFLKKGKINYTQQFQLIFRSFIVFQLLNILLYCILSLSFRFHLPDVYSARFWSDDQSINSNLSFAIACFLIIPYFTSAEHVKISLIKDITITTIFIHTVLCLLHSLQFNIGYLLYIAVISCTCVGLASYISAILEQRDLINEIKTIQREDRESVRIESEQNSQSTTLKYTDENINF